MYPADKGGTTVKGEEFSIVTKSPASFWRQMYEKHLVKLGPGKGSIMLVKYFLWAKRRGPAYKLRPLLHNQSSFHSSLVFPHMAPDFCDSSYLSLRPQSYPSKHTFLQTLLQAAGSGIGAFNWKGHPQAQDGHHTFNWC